MALHSKSDAWCVRSTDEMTSVFCSTSSYVDGSTLDGWVRSPFGTRKLFRLQLRIFAGFLYYTLLGVPSFSRFWRWGFGEFPRLVGRYCSYLLPKQTRGAPQILIFKTLQMTGHLTIYYNGNRILWHSYIVTNRVLRQFWYVQTLIQKYYECLDIVTNGLLWLLCHSPTVSQLANIRFFTFPSNFILQEFEDYFQEVQEMAANNKGKFWRMTKHQANPNPTKYFCIRSRCIVITCNMYYILFVCWLQSRASGHSLGFEDKNLDSSPGLFGQ